MPVELVGVWELPIVRSVMGLLNLLLIGDLHQWALLNLSSPLDPEVDIPWSSIWAHACYYIWCWRNYETFRHDFHRPSMPGSYIHSGVKNYLEAVDVVGAKVSRVGYEALIGWMPPVEDWISLNSDGAS
ncbi:hypothetical protein RIF29_42455 [Crotalaria pallida]|uniref:Uncharacterized protein n=1 Tax=Crotalaria pallida TaxID=3830 RepID=A0AAN9ECS4_CROPI